MGKREKAFENLFQQWEGEYREGSHMRLLQVVEHCMVFEQRVPHWAIVLFSAAIGRYIRAEVKTLDDAFEIQRPKGWHQNRARERYRRGLRAHLKARGLVQRRGYTVENAIAEIAEQLSMSEADVERWYYDEQIMKDIGYPQKIEKN